MINLLNTNTTLGRFENELCNGYGIAPKVAKSIADLSKEVFIDDKETNSFISGQIKYEAVSANQPVGVPREECKTKTIVLTLIDRSDNGLSSSDKRKNIIQRITREAYEQDCLLTQNDLASLLNSDARTVRRTIKELSKDKIVLPLRGNIKNIGRGQTHKNIIIELALKKYTFSDISHKTHHSFGSIDRYLNKFCKVIHCYLKKMPIDEICYICGNSANVVKQYIEIYRKHKDSCKEQLDILLRKYKDFDVSEISKKKMKVMSKWLKK